MTSIQTLSHKQVAALIKAVGHEQTILIEGEAGSGKTAIAHEFAVDPHFAGYHFVKPIDCTQLSDGSVWMPDIDRELGVSRELPNERFGVHTRNQRGVPGSQPVLLCLDELAKSRQFIKDVLAPVAYERRVGNYVMPEKSVVFGCTNLSEEGLGDSLQAHLRNRITIVRMRKPTQKEWVQDFAIPNGLAPEVIAATEMFPMVFDSFLDYQAGGKYAGKDLARDNPYIANPRDGAQEQVVTPRSLHAASKLIKASAGFDDSTLQAALAGTVGAPFASQMAALIRFGRDLPSFSRVIADPENCPLPDSPTAQIVQVFQFITQGKTREQCACIVTYVKRMKNEMQSLFANTVAGSTNIATYCTLAEFNTLLQNNKVFFS
jgi:hypothetical protein